jgi:hypothetical protein
MEGGALEGFNSESSATLCEGAHRAVDGPCMTIAGLQRTRAVHVRKCSTCASCCLLHIGGTGFAGLTHAARCGGQVPQAFPVTPRAAPPAENWGGPSASLLLYEYRRRY